MFNSDGSAVLCHGTGDNTKNYILMGKEYQSFMKYYSAWVKGVQNTEEEKSFFIKELQE